MRGVLVLVGLLVLAGLLGCVSPFPIPDKADEFLVVDHTEVRSLFGTNGGFDVLKKCKGPSRPVLFYLQADFTDCQLLAVGGEIAAHKSSQGQGGQILQGLMNAGALGGLAAVQAGTSAGSSVSSSAASAVTNTVINLRGYGHR